MININSLERTWEQFEISLKQINKRDRCDQVDIRSNKITLILTNQIFDTPNFLHLFFTIEVS